MLGCRVIGLGCLGLGVALGFGRRGKRFRVSFGWWSEASMIAQENLIPVATAPAPN